jgi:sucrose-6F-phosphate phosphohydrolase
MRLIRPFLFGSDLDGTLLPNGPQAAPEGCLKRTRELLKQLEKQRCPVCFVSGRHLALAQKARAAFKLPRPDYWVCNVGSEIYSQGGRADGQWSARLGPVFNHSVMWAALNDIAGLRPQEREKQGPHKFSLYYEHGEGRELQDEILARMQGLDAGLKVIHSVDIFTGRGLIDVLPLASGKAQALEYLAARHAMAHEAVFFAGDSGNDLDALTHGFSGTLVGNAPAEVQQQARGAAEASHGVARLFIARQAYGDGIIEGLHHYGLVET